MDQQQGKTAMQEDFASQAAGVASVLPVKQTKQATRDLQEETLRCFFKEPRYSTLDKPAAFKKKAPRVFAALQMIQAYSPLGKKLYDWAKESQIPFREEKMDFLGLGGWMVSCNETNSTSLNTGIVAHEIMHVVQLKHYDLYSDISPDMDGRSLIIFKRGLEAGAVAAQLRVLYEMKLNGCPDPWQDMQDNIFYTKDLRGEDVRALGKYRDISEHFERQFKDARAAGKNTEDALTDAASTAHQAYHLSQGLRDSYNGLYLKDYLGRVLSGKCGTHLPQSNIDPRILNEMTKLPDGSHLIHYTTSLPLTDEALFGENKLMRQAFDYVEGVRLMDFYGDDHYAYQKHLHMMREDNNPFTALDPYTVMTEIRKRKTQTSLEVMKEMAGIENVRQLSLDFDIAAADRRAKKSGSRKPATGKTRKARV